MSDTYVSIADAARARNDARRTITAPAASKFAAVRLLPDGNGGWLDPEIAVGEMLGQAVPREQFARFLADRVAAGRGHPVAVIEIRPLGHGRQLVAVIGDDAPPLGAPAAEAEAAA